jgi:hypothetical protein
MQSSFFLKWTICVLTLLWQGSSKKSAGGWRGHNDVTIWELYEKQVKIRAL